MLGFFITESLDGISECPFFDFCNYSNMVGSVSPAPNLIFDCNVAALLGVIIFSPS